MNKCNALNNPIPKILNSFHLKVIAIVTMLIDHFAYIPLASVLSESYSVKEGSAVYDGFKQSFLMWVADHQDLLWQLNDLCHWIGRIAFPIFCFLMVQGFTFTKDRKKYVVRLGIFALISEVPYDMAFNGCLLSFRNNNVFFTLLTGLLMIWVISYAKEKFKKGIYFVSLVVVFLAATYLVVNVFDSSYSASGVAAILIIYLLRDKAVMGVFLSVIALTALNMSFIEAFALISVLCIAMYNGKKGPSIKYFFYGFYPGHLFVFALLAIWLGSMNVYMGFME